MRPFSLICLTLLPALVAISASAQTIRIGIIDFYGLRTVSPEQARAVLGFTEGDIVPQAVADAERALAALPGVTAARVSRVCCEDGRAVVYVGIAETGAPLMTFRAEPAGDVRLPGDVLKAGEAFDAVFMKAIERGNASEDHTRGHSLMKDPAARRAQQEFVPLAQRHLDRLRDVLRHSSDAEHRALAVQVIAYAKDKRSVIDDLTYAASDPEGRVRNNAIRTLWVIADYGRQSPKLKIRIPTAPFVDLLNSLVWEDRNKASALLADLTRDHDPALLDVLRERAVPSLTEMAQWKGQGHAEPSLLILARLAGLSEETIGMALASDARRGLLERALEQLAK